jgi:hypothetical protein
MKANLVIRSRKKKVAVAWEESRDGHQASTAMPYTGGTNVMGVRKTFPQ